MKTPPDHVFGGILFKIVMAKNIFILALLLSSVAVGRADGSSAASVRQRSGSLYELVEKASRNQIRRDSDGFRVPTDGQLKAWRFIVESIFAGRMGDAQQMIRQLSFPYELSRFTERSDGHEYIVLEETVPLQAGWGFYVFDPASKNPLVLEAPHPVFDSNTEFQAIDAFVQTGASAYLLAGAHRRANKQDTPCNQPKSAESSATYPVSDVAHAVATPFHAVHEALVKVRPAMVAVQLHGMTDRQTCPSAFISNGSPSVTTNSRKLLGCLTKGGVEAEIYDGDATCPLTALSNVQGRFSNGETKDPCKNAVSSSPEPGAFIHIEQEPSIRKDRSSWQPVIDALKCAFPGSSADPAKAPAPGRRSYVFKAGDNPAVTVFYHTPAKIDNKTRVIVVMAGRQRNADEYLDPWVDWASKHNYVVLSPQFSQKDWPEPLGYNFGNIATGREASNTPNPKPRWAFTVVEQMFEEAKSRFGLKAKEYDLFGHSAGGQFVHRFMLYMPENKVRLAIAANPGFYTLPDLNTVFPYGVKNSPFRITEDDIRNWVKTDLVLMRGTADLQRTESLRQTPEADAQGKNRFERAAYMFERVRGVDKKTKWRLIDVPGVAHDQKGMALAAQRVLEAEL